MRRDFLPVQTGPGAHPASCTMGSGFFPGVKSGRRALTTTHSILVPRSWKNRAIPLPTLWATTGPVTGTRYLYKHCVVHYCSTLFTTRFSNYMKFVKKIYMQNFLRNAAIASCHNVLLAYRLNWRCKGINWRVHGQGG